MNYREYIHKAVTDTDFDDKEDVTMLVQWLMSEAVENHDIMMKQEEKLSEIMSAKDFKEFTHGIADEILKSKIECMPESDFKDFLIKNYDLITDDSKSFFEVQEEIAKRENDNDQM